jgi:hypothetical protein
MRRQQSIPARVYQNIFPKPGQDDPHDFNSHLCRSLIPEVRVETQRFYGGLDTIEAKYPGLNYFHPPHRMRLSRFPHHARLFRAFNELRLTEYEISELCKWEGTLWARQRFERDERIKVLDTTGDDIPMWTPRKSRKTSRHSKIVVETTVSVVTEQHQPMARHSHRDYRPTPTPANTRNSSTPLDQSTRSPSPMDSSDGASTPTLLLTDTDHTRDSTPSPYDCHDMDDDAPTVHIQHPRIMASTLSEGDEPPQAEIVNDDVKDSENVAMPLFPISLQAPMSSPIQYASTTFDGQRRQ